MKKIIALFTMLISATTYSSSMIIESKNFRCSDGNKYDLAILITGGWGDDSWQFQGLCSDGTLRKKSYNGRGNDPKDVRRCKREKTNSIRRCYQEFKSLNGLSGSGKLEEVKSTQNRSGEYCSVVNYRYVICNGTRYDRSRRVYEDRYEDTQRVFEYDNPRKRTLRN
jgi:hypothetical protein